MIALSNLEVSDVFDLVFLGDPDREIERMYLKFEPQSPSRKFNADVSSFRRRIEGLAEDRAEKSELLWKLSQETFREAMTKSFERLSRDARRCGAVRWIIRTVCRTTARWSPMLLPS